MAETLDINIVSNNIIDINIILQAIREKMHVDIIIKQIEKMDNWEYENCCQITEMQTIPDEIHNKKIVCYDMKTLNGINCGVYMENIQKKYCTCIWFDTKKIEFFNNGTINEKYTDFFDIISNVVISKANKYQIDFVGIGIESSFEYTGDKLETIQHSTDILRWLIFNENVTLIDGFTIIKDFDNCKIYKEIASDNQ